METQIVKLETPELNLIEKSKAEQIKKTFEPMVKMLEEFEDAYNSIIVASQKEITESTTYAAKRLRLDIGKIRIEAEKVRKEQKEEYLRAGKAIDAVNNILKWAITDKENKLKEIEDYFEIQERQRIEKLQSDRAVKLSKYVEDANERDLGNMDEDVWNAYFNQKKQDYEDRLVAEKKAEEERRENERLDKLEYDRRIEISPYAQFIDKAPAIRSMSEEEYQKLLASLQKAKVDYDKQQEQVRKDKEAAEKKLAQERKERQKIEAEINAKKEAEEKEKQRIAEEKRKAELAPDKDKLLDFAGRLDNIDIPVLQSEGAKQILSDAQRGIYQITQMIYEKIKSLK